MFAVTIHSDFGAPWNKVCHCFHCFPIYLPWNDETRYDDLSFLNVEPAFSLYSFTFIKRFFSSYSLSAIRVISSAYLRSLTVLIPACDSPSPVFCKVYSVYKLYKQGDNIHLWCTPFPILNQSVVPCPILLLLLHINFSGGRSGGLVVWYPHLFKNFHNLLWSTQSKALV